MRCQLSLSLASVLAIFIYGLNIYKLFCSDLYSMFAFCHGLLNLRFFISYK